MQWIAKAADLGAGEFLVTSMDRDGTGQGYDLELTRQAAKITRAPIIASGGVGTLEHMLQGLQAGASGVLAAGIFHFGTYTVGQAKEFLASKGINVRPPQGATHE
jgi:cyclase